MLIDRKLEEYSRRLAMELSGWWDLKWHFLHPVNFSTMILRDKGAGLEGRNWVLISMGPWLASSLWFRLPHLQNGRWPVLPRVPAGPAALGFGFSGWVECLTICSWELLRSMKIAPSCLHASILIKSEQWVYSCSIQITSGSYISLYKYMCAFSFLRKKKARDW